VIIERERRPGSSSPAVKQMWRAKGDVEEVVDAPCFIGSGVDQVGATARRALGSPP
jgi:hypothetical protein